MSNPQLNFMECIRCKESTCHVFISVFLIFNLALSYALEWT
jgi:hypothetical protein